MGTRALFLLCGLLAASGVSANLGYASVSGLEFVPRFTRLLRQDLSGVASYLLPTSMPQLCDNDCCQEDSYASPYGLLYLNQSQQVYGGRTYTTFFYQFHSNHTCSTALDKQQCCTASADTIWVDVDPTLKVKYVAVNGQRLINTEQSEYGLMLGSLNLKVGAAQQGVPIAITVEGAADALCPPPGLAPLAGLCEIIVQGSNSASSNACCPRTVTVKSTGSFPTPDHGFQCSASLDNSPYKLVLDQIAPAAAPAGQTQSYLVYSFRLMATSTCNPGGVTDCCSAQLAYINMRVTDLAIKDVRIGGQAVNFTTSTWNEPNSASYRSLLIDNLNLVADDLGDIGLPVVITAVVSSGAANPDLCDASSDPAQGACSYYLHSEDGFCCPSGLAIPSMSLPPPPPGTCAPTDVVLPSETSMSLRYYERIGSAATTTFAFLLADHNPATGCTYSYCVDVCSWTLFLDPTVAANVAVGHENPVNNGRQVMAPTSSASGAPVALTFPYGPVGEATNMFFVTMPAGGKRLTDLCARNALPTQDGKACAAIVRSASVYILVFFDDSDVIIIDGNMPPSPPPPVVPMCSAPKPMSASCFGVSSGRYNTLSNSAVFEFKAAPAAVSCGSAFSNGQATVHLLLNPATVDQLTTRPDVRPSSGLKLDRNDGARWALSTSATTNLAFQVQGPLGPAAVCLQGATSDQPAGTCVVEVLGDSDCFRGYVAASSDGRLLWGEGAAAPGKKGVDTAVVIPAVVIPAVVLLALLILGAVLYRRRRNQQYFFMNSGSDDLDRPLATQSGSHPGSIRDDLSAPSATPSDVHIRVPGASQGGAAPQS